MSDPTWVERDVALAVHDEQIAEHGGLTGIRDENMLESALGRPMMKYRYGEDDLAVLAAAYAYGLARNHPFADGNKRTAYVVMELFLALNGYAFNADDVDAAITFLRLAAGEIDEAALAAWISSHLTAYPAAADAAATPKARKA